MQIVNELLEFLKSKSISVYKFSKETGIPKQRVYDWKSKNVAPKYNDVLKIKDYMSSQNEKKPSKKESRKILAANLKRIRIEYGYDIRSFIQRMAYDNEIEMRLYENPEGFIENDKSGKNIIIDNAYHLLREMGYDTERMDIETKYINPNDNHNLIAELNAQLKRQTTLTDFKSKDVDAAGDRAELRVADDGE